MAKYSARYWHKAEEGSVCNDLISTVDSIITEQEGRTTDNIRFASLYKAKKVKGFEPGDWFVSHINIETGEMFWPITYNVIKSATDTVVSKITMNKPKPRFLTEEGSEQQQQRARDLEKFVDGILYNTDAHARATDALRDACIYGIGILKVFEIDGVIKIEKVHPSRIVVDDNSALNGEPRSMFQKEFVSREALISMFPEHEQIIRGAKLFTGNHFSASRDMIEVYEAWHLSCGETKGRHVICIESGILLDEEWDEEAFPFVVIRWSKDVMGWHGVGLAEELEGIQREINNLLSKVRDNMHLLSVPYILKPRGSDISDDQLLSNEMARMIEYSGNIPPRIEVPPAVNPQIFQQLETLYRRAFEVAGVSQLSATSTKPAGIESGVALRTLQDVESQRFSTVSRAFEDMFVGLAKKIMGCARRLEESGEELSIKYDGKSFVERIKWSDVKMDEEQFILKVYPASSLPNTPAGKLETVIDMMKAGLIGPDIAGNLLDFPDLEKYNSLMNSAMDDIEATMEHMLAKGEYVEPLPYQNLALGIKLGTHYYLRAKLRGESAERLDLVLRWLSEANDLLNPPPPETEMTMPGGAEALGPTLPGREVPSPLAGVPGIGGEAPMEAPMETPMAPGEAGPTGPPPVPSELMGGAGGLPR